jgi:hypothetical protein
MPALVDRSDQGLGDEGEPCHLHLDDLGDKELSPSVTLYQMVTWMSGQVTSIRTAVGGSCSIS